VQHVRSSGWRRAGIWIAALTAVTSTAAACTTTTSGHQNGGARVPGVAAPSAGGSGSAAQPAPSGSSSSSAAAPLELRAMPGRKHDINPTTPIKVVAAHGTLSSVRLTNPEGKVVSGRLSADHTSWQTSEVLGYSKTYRLVAKATTGTGETVRTLHRQFTTLTPPNMTMPYLNTIYGSSIEDGATYGVGMIPVVHFDEAITDKAAAERSLHVTTSPHVDGSWYWLDDSNVHWRPQNYYQPGTSVTVAADVYGVNVGGGIYGQADQKVSFTIGAKHVAIANAATHHVKVYFNDKLVRRMPTSMGRGGTVQGRNGPIYLWTMPGTYTVIGHENPATMSSDSYGLPANSPLGYAPEKVPFATKISTDGIYLHELDTTLGYQGHSNVSHGCLNLNQANASWYYRTSRVGDIVKVVHSGGPRLQLWQGGDWTLTWAQWQQGSAL
jgi:lipoprotein-anchoring transpeptidase ErfK/SrfK